MALNGNKLQGRVIIYLMYLFVKTLHTAVMLWRCYAVQTFTRDAIL